MNCKINLKKIVFLLLIISLTQTLSAEWVEPSRGIRYQILDDSLDDKDLYLTTGLQVQAAPGSGGLGMRLNARYTADYNGFDPFILTIDHALIDFGSPFYPPLNSLTDRMPYSYLKLGGEFSLFDIDIEWLKHIVVASHTSGDYTYNYFFPAPAKAENEIAFRGGYVHNLGHIWGFRRSVDYRTRVLLVEGRMHGIYLGASWTFRHRLDLEYEVYGMFDTHNEDIFMKHTLDFYWFPIMEVNSGDMPGLYQPDMQLGAEYSVKLIMFDFLSATAGFKLDPTVRSMGSTESATDLSNLMHKSFSIVLGFGIALTN